MTSTSETVFLLRHTQTDWNAISRYQGRLDSQLSELGKKQVDIIAALVRPGDFQTVYSSSLSRARTLAEAIGKAAGAPVVEDNRLTEIGMGTWEGLYRDEIESQFPQMFHTWQDRPDEVSLPGGETLNQVADRVRPFMEGLFADANGSRVCVVSHDAVVKIAIMLSLGLELRHLHRFCVRNGSISILRGSQYVGAVETVDSVAHLTNSPFELIP